MSDDVRHGFPFRFFARCRSLSDAFPYVVRTLANRTHVVLFLYLHVSCFKIVGKLQVIHQPFYSPKRIRDGEYAVGRKIGLERVKFPVEMKITFRHTPRFLMMIYVLTAIGSTPGGSSTVHIYTQTIYRTTQLIREECPFFTTYGLAFAIQLRKEQGKTSDRVAEECQLAR
jgi:hypothetical protein